jgi:hypothetical protein
LRRSITDTIRAVNLAATGECVIFRSVLLAGVLFLVSFDGLAEAHPEFAPSTVNRYIKLDLVAPNELRLAYTVMVGAAPAAAWRRAADANANGMLDDAERTAIGERARAAVAAGFQLSVDGKPVTLAFEPPAVGLAGNEVAPSPLSVDLIARVTLPGAPPHVVRVDDATPEPQLGETEIRVEESPATRIVRAHRGPTGDEKQTRFLFRGPKFSALEDRSVTVELTAAAPAAAGATGGVTHGAAKAATSHRPSRATWLVAAALLAGLTALVVVRIRQRRMNG